MNISASVYLLSSCSQMGELPIKEHYYCELCNVTVLNRCGLDRHSLSVKHKNAVNAQLEAIILSMRVAGKVIKNIFVGGLFFFICSYELYSY